MKGKAGKRLGQLGIQWHLMACLTAFVAVLMLLLIPLRTPLLRLFGASDVTLPYAVSYFTLYLLGTPFALLSGGMNQRVGTAIAMVMEPSVLLADEPTGALDVTAQRQVVGELLQLRERFGTAILLVTHDIGVVSAMADMVLVLKDGRIMEYGPARQVLQKPQDDYTRKLLAAVPKLRRA